MVESRGTFCFMQFCSTRHGIFGQAAHVKLMFHAHYKRYCGVSSLDSRKSCVTHYYYKRSVDAGCIFFEYISAVYAFYKEILLFALVIHAPLIFSKSYRNKWLFIVTFFVFTARQRNFQNRDNQTMNGKKYFDFSKVYMHILKYCNI